MIYSLLSFFLSPPVSRHPSLSAISATTLKNSSLKHVSVFTLDKIWFSCVASTFVLSLSAYAVNLMLYSPHWTPSNAGETT